MPTTGTQRSDDASKLGPVYFSAPRFHYGWLSQWYPSTFRHNGDTYKTAEMWMMVQKARLFNDEIAAQKILAEPSPSKNRKQGRDIKNFVKAIWDDHKLDIVVMGNLLKFTQSIDATNLRRQLLATGDRELAESVTYDRVWGIGYPKYNASINRHDWGLNLLGLALEEVRQELMRQSNS